MSQSTWWSSDFPVTQAWGASAYGGEPAGHGVAHWHAGLDIGMPCGTPINYPGGLGLATISAKVQGISGGYGNLLIVHMPGGLGDIYLGHLRDWSVQDGQQISAGALLGHSNNTGNSTGCHLHFELRPPGGAYGSDINPSAMLRAGSGNVGTAALSIPGLDVGTAIAAAGTQIQTGLHDAFNRVMWGAEVAGGLALMLGGGALLALTVALGSKQAQSAALGAVGIKPARRPSRRPSGARASRTRASGTARQAAPAAPEAAPEAAPADDGTRRQTQLVLRSMGYSADEARQGLDSVDWTARPDRNAAAQQALTKLGQRAK